MSLAEDVKRDPKLKLAFSGAIGIFWLDFLDQWDPKSPWHDKRVRLAANYAINRQELTEAETLGASKPTGSMVPRAFEFALPFEPYPYDPAKAKQLLAEAGYPNGFDAGDLTVVPPYFDMGEAIVNYLMAVGIRMKSRPMERAAFFAALNAKQLRGVCVCGSGRYGNAATRLEEMAVTWGSTAYGGYPDIDALFKQQDVETDRSKREALLHQIQQLIHERVMFGPIWEYIWPSAASGRWVTTRGGAGYADQSLPLVSPSGGRASQARVRHAYAERKGKRPLGAAPSGAPPSVPASGRAPSALPFPVPRRDRPTGAPRRWAESGPARPGVSRERQPTPTH